MARALRLTVVKQDIGLADGFMDVPGSQRIGREKDRITGVDVKGND
jgi:hypothetical protein